MPPVFVGGDLDTPPVNLGAACWAYAEADRSAFPPPLPVAEIVAQSCLAELCRRFASSLGAADGGEVGATWPLEGGEAGVE